MAFLPSGILQNKGPVCQFISYWDQDNATAVCFRVRIEGYYLLLWATGERRMKGKERRQEGGVFWGMRSLHKLQSKMMVSG